MRHYKAIFETRSRETLLIIEQDRSCMGKDFMDGCVRWMYYLAEDYPEAMLGGGICAHVSVDGLEFATLYSSLYYGVLTIILAGSETQRPCCIRCSELDPDPSWTREDVEDR